MSKYIFKVYLWLLEILDISFYSLLILLHIKTMIQKKPKRYKLTIRLFHNGPYLLVSDVRWTRTSDNRFQMPHCRMRSRSRALIAATYKSSAIDVVFGAQSIGNIRILTFQRGSTLKFLKYF